MSSSEQKRGKWQNKKARRKKTTSCPGGLVRCFRIENNKKMLQRLDLQREEDGDLSQPEGAALSKSRALQLVLLLTIKRTPDSQTDTDVEAI